MVNHSIDPVVIVDEHKNYHQFLLKIKEKVPALTDYENQVLTMFSIELLNGKRKHEIILLDMLLQQDKVEYNEFLSRLVELNCQIDEATINSVKRILDLSFFTEGTKNKYGEIPILTLNGENDFTFNDSIRESLNANSYFKFMVMDIVQCAKEKASNIKVLIRLRFMKNIQEKMPASS